MALFGTNYRHLQKLSEKKTSKRVMICGVYIIKNDNLKSCYIGKSKNIDYRVNTHLSALRDNLYICYYPEFQIDYDGNSCSFETEVLEICSKDMLLERETFWLKEYNKKGYKIYNRLTETKNITGVFIPTSYKEVIERVVIALDRGVINETSLNDFLREYYGA